MYEAARQATASESRCEPIDPEIARAIDRHGWSLGDVYRELGGGGPRQSQLHRLFAGFFNGQVRAIAGSTHDASKLEYSAGTTPRGAALRDAALEALAGRGWAGGPERVEADHETCALVLAHNQLDTEVRAHFASAAARAARRALRDRERSPSEREVVCVLGMSRSGTSLTTRILNVLGVSLGGEHRLMAPVAGNNPKGFWEHDAIVKLDEEILAAVSEDPARRPAWVRPPALPPGWERNPVLAPHRRAARSILRESFDGVPVWGWKDPRACLTLPFWKQLVPEMRYVLCVRHPSDVAASLETRDGIPREWSLNLWLVYTANAVLNTRGCQRTVVSHESYFPSWESQAERLAAFLDNDTISTEQRSAIADHLEDSLWHHRDGEHAGDRLPGEVETLYQLLATLARSGPDPVTEAALDEAARKGVAVAAVVPEG